MVLGFGCTSALVSVLFCFVQGLSCGFEFSLRLDYYGCGLWFVDFGGCGMLLVRARLVHCVCLVGVVVCIDYVVFGCCVVIYVWVSVVWYSIACSLDWLVLVCLVCFGCVCFAMFRSFDGLWNLGFDYIVSLLP